jgi:hypothetical protein
MLQRALKIRPQALQAAQGVRLERRAAVPALSPARLIIRASGT